MFWPCETRTSTCRSFATISSGLYRFLAIAVLLDVKDIPQVGPLQWGWIKIVDVEFQESSLLAREQQVATPPSSIGVVEPSVPSTRVMPPSRAAESVASPVEVSASSRPASVRQRRRLQPAAIQRRRRSVPSTPSRGQENATSSSGGTEPGKVPAPSQHKASG